MKNKQYHVLDSFGVLSVFLALGLCLMVSAPVWNNPQSEDLEKTMRRAENLAYQIIEARHDANHQNVDGNRVPASELDLSRLRAQAGEIGRDLWGKPFHFKILQNDPLQTQIVVWSAGPNGTPETTDEEPDSAQAFQFAGDDIGAVVKVNRSSQ